MMIGGTEVNGCEGYTPIAVSDVRGIENANVLSNSKSKFGYHPFDRALKGFTIRDSWAAKYTKLVHNQIDRQSCVCIEVITFSREE